MNSIKLLLTLTTIFAVASSGLAQKTISGKTNPVYLDVGNGAPGASEADITVTWITPDDFASSHGEKTLNVKIGINSGSEITDIKIFINDQPVTVRGITVVENTGFDDFDKYVERELRLNEGDNTIKLVASNTRGETITDSRVVKLPVAGKGTLARTDYALLFATDEYDSWGDLTNPINDAKTIADELENHYGFKVELITNPSHDEILIKLKEYARKSYMELDQLFVFFAGHGQFDEIYGEGYIVATNSKLNDVAKTSYLSHSVLRNVVDNIPSQHTFLAMDVCFGGTFDPLIAKAGTRGQDEYSEVSQNEFIQRKLRFKTRRFVTSGGKEYVPDGRPGMHSPFARKFLEALRSYGGNDNILTLPEVFGYVEKITPEPRAGEFGTNEPGSDFLFVTK